MKLLILLLPLLASCNSMFVVRGQNSSYMAYAGSFASKALSDNVEIIAPDGVSLKREIIEKDEVEAINVIGRVALTKLAIVKGAEVADKTLSTAKEIIK